MYLPERALKQATQAQRRSPHSSGLHKQMHQQRHRGRMLSDVLWLLHQSEDHSDHPLIPVSLLMHPCVL